MLQEEISVRQLQPEDWESFRNLRLKALRENPKAYGIAETDEAVKSEREWKSIAEDAFQGKGKWYAVAVDKSGELIGMMGAVESFGTYVRHQVEITQAYVDPQFRRLKIMKKMFYFLKRELQKVDHLEQLIVWVTLHENQIGREMFKKFGFVEVGKISKSVKFEGRYYDCSWLEAPLRGI